jgi:tRNA-2-methylthio-N6-dimethylallyladenosine synthase
MTQPRTMYLETMGCQMNVLDSELVVGALLERGYQLTHDMISAELVVINTCSVRQHAEEKVYSRLGQLKGGRRSHPDQIVAVIGCMAERDGEGLLSKAPDVDILCGPGDLHRLPGLIDEVRARHVPAIALSGRLSPRSTPLPLAGAHDDLETLDSGRAFGLGIAGVAARYQAYVRITRGCNKFCTFCVVPYTRGPEVHRPPDQIVAEVRRLAEAGIMEVTLLGQTVNHYHYSDERGEETSFAQLLRRVHDEVPQLPRLRFVTSFPRDFTDEALRVMAESPRICKYLHIPAQSGSNTVLKRMNRGYSVEEYKSLLDRARALMPDISIAGDMIVGFSGESEDDFAASLDLLRYARYKNCFIFKYSPRPGTNAFDRLEDDVSELVKRRRNNDMLAVQAEINLANHQAMIGQVVEVLVEGPSKKALAAQESEQSRGEEIADRSAYSGQLVGRTGGDQIVVFDGDPGQMGQLVEVRVVGVTPYTLYGELSRSCTPATANGHGKQISLPVI